MDATTSRRPAPSAVVSSTALITPARRRARRLGGDRLDTLVAILLTFAVALVAVYDLALIFTGLG